MKVSGPMRDSEDFDPIRDGAVEDEILFEARDREDTQAIKARMFVFVCRECPPSG